MFPAPRRKQEEHEKRRAMLADELRPRTLEQLQVFGEMSPEPVKTLLELTRDATLAAEMPHILLYGPPGSGKRTLALCLLASIFGEAVHSEAGEQVMPGLPDDSSVQPRVIRSPFHVEVASFDDFEAMRAVVHALEEIRQHRASRVGWTGVILSDVDKACVDAQMALRKPMEDTANTCRFILITSQPTRVREELRSRTCMIRVQAPSEQRICRAVHRLATHAQTNAAGWRELAASETHQRAKGRSIEDLGRLAQGNLRAALSAAELLASNLDLNTAEEALGVLVEGKAALLARKLASLPPTCEAPLASRPMLYALGESGVRYSTLFRNIAMSFVDRVRAEAARRGHLDFQGACGTDDARRSERQARLAAFLDTMTPEDNEGMDLSDPDQLCADLMALAAMHEAGASSNRNDVHHIEGFLSRALSRAFPAPSATA